MKVFRYSVTFPTACNGIFSFKEGNNISFLDAENYSEFIPQIAVLPLAYAKEASTLEIYYLMLIKSAGVTYSTGELEKLEKKYPCLIRPHCSILVP